jgi:hypothetical protein
VNVAAAAAARAGGVIIVLDAGGEDAPIAPALLAAVGRWAGCQHQNPC